MCMKKVMICVSNKQACRLYYVWLHYLTCLTSVGKSKSESVGRVVLQNIVDFTSKTKILLSMWT